ncbi:uncharacterized protein DUF4136 [Pontibacter ummariensis]|uniref:DUF4136 domain-containing protein n=1 Tax=Pontibacter ummariensis TaxID=1610492 RepID=A0A239FJY3_9BACT|nr:DUF4136 domain-containing protein [Pontibacter ummariensis]PRY12041.1 uncharacterized protein DUF4136 [Pontibacter ummariensis]SNS57206.1 protein of unknown function [Pontibacter ummariensis]
MKRPFALAGCLLLLAGTFFLQSCVTTSASVGANTIQAPYVQTGSYKTFAWFQPDAMAPAAYEKGFGASLNKNLRRAIEEELQERGYQKVTTNPDVLVAYDVSVSVPEEKDKPENFAPGFGYSYGYMSGYRYDYKQPGMPGYRSVDLFKEGTLIIDLINPRTNMLEWRGWAEGAINNFKAGYNKVHGQVEEVMEKL